MTSYKPLRWPEARSPRLTDPARRGVAVVLRAASAVLERMAQRVAVPRVVAPAILPTTVEFYAEAGAAEGALYIDGELAAWLPGVTRL